MQQSQKTLCMYLLRDGMHTSSTMVDVSTWLQIYVYALNSNPKKMVRQRKTLLEIYKPYLCKLMAFIDGANQAYPQTIEFSEEQLLDITPSQISQWMKKTVYGTPTPGPNNHPTHCRSSVLEQAKKAGKKSISPWFMPNKHTKVKIRLGPRISLP